MDPAFYVPLVRPVEPEPTDPETLDLFAAPTLPDERSTPTPPVPEESAS